jgi:hypothetical protein
MIELNPPAWRKSTRCNESACVEVALGESAMMRDSKLTDSPVLTFDRESWTAFVAGARAGEFD